MTTTYEQSKITRAFGYAAHTSDRMFCYLWSKDDKECKFGERWVKAGLDPELDCWSRIRSSIDVMKHIVDDGRVHLHAIWDVSELAALPAVNRMYQHARVDDYIRTCIMHRIGRSEFHKIHWQVAKERVSKFLASSSSFKPAANLDAIQQDRLDQALAVIASGKATFIANLCPRFGKTIWALSLFNATTALYGNRIMLLPAYWLSVHTSFKNELAKYGDFDDVVFIDAKDPEADQKAASAWQDGKRLLIAISLHGGTDAWCLHHEWVAEIDNDEFFVFADEGDFGTHTDNQQEKLSFIFNGA